MSTSARDSQFRLVPKVTKSHRTIEEYLRDVGAPDEENIRRRVDIRRRTCYIINREP
jgi:hypothetical protein